MRILVCNERFLFRFGVDRVLLLLASEWRKKGHEVVLMGNRYDEDSIKECADRFINLPLSSGEEPNAFTAKYIEENWRTWFETWNEPDVVLVAGWPFYASIPVFKAHSGAVIVHDYGGVPTDGMNENEKRNQLILGDMRNRYYSYADKIIAISKFIEDSQSAVISKGEVPTTNVLLGADHMEKGLWKNSSTKTSEDKLINKLKKLKEKGYYLLLQPGRFEGNNYKNSRECLKVVDSLKEKGINKFYILLLSQKEDLSGVSNSYKKHLYALGHVSDATLVEIMKLVHLGYLPTLWEGFDLPLAEMQYLEKPMYVYNIGAHPEVACHKHFLCENHEELIEKIVAELNGKSLVDEAEIKKSYEDFRRDFTWEKCANRLIEEMRNTLEDSKLFIFDVSHTCMDSANSGVIRVTRKLSKNIQKRERSIFVKWVDSNGGEYVLLNSAEVEMLSRYGGPIQERVDYRSSEDERVRLLDVLDELKAKNKICVFVEVLNGSEMKKQMHFMHSHNIQTAVIFHDAIPILRENLVEEGIAKNHKVYMKELETVDVVIPTADHNAEDLKDYWKANGLKGTRVEVVDLATEIDSKERNTTQIDSYPEGKKKIVFVSTLEPRKNHIRFLKGFGKLLEEHPELNDEVELNLVGKTYGDNTEIPNFVNEFCEKHPNTKWLGAVDDETLIDLYDTSLFTAYPSEIEGFGMPIVESLWAGKPCLCSDSGSIGELAEKCGGCAATNIMSEDAIAESLYKLLSDEEYYIRLQHEATTCEITTWDKYGKNVIKLFEKPLNTFEDVDKVVLEADIRQKLTDYLNSQDGETLIAINGYYYPYLVGGAEVVLNNHLESMKKNKCVNPIVLTVDRTNTYRPNHVELDFHNDIPIIRLAVQPNQMGIDTKNFFSKEFNDLFKQVCELVKPKYVHVHNISGTSLSVVDIAKEYNAKTFITFHDVWGFCHKSTMLKDGELCGNIHECDKCKNIFTGDGEYDIPIQIRKSFLRRNFAKVDGFITPSKYLGNKYIEAGLPVNRMHAILNGIDVERFKDITKTNSDKVRITFIGHLGFHKGVHVLLNAMNNLKDKEVLLNIVGEGNSKEEYLEYVKENNMEDCVVFHGYKDRDSIRDILANTDIFCLPSVCPENSPVTIAEAMSAGVAVVASRIGGIPELVDDNQTGLLFEAGNVEDLCEKINSLLEDKNLIESLGKKGKEKISKFDYDSQVKEIYSLMKETEISSDVIDKPILLVKGNRIPLGLGLIKDNDVLKLEWLVNKDEYKYVKAVIVLANNVLSKEEKEDIVKHNIPVICEKGDADLFKDINTEIITYNDVKELMATTNTYSK